MINEWTRKLDELEKKVDYLQKDNESKEKELKLLRRLAHKYPNGANGCCCLFDDDFKQIVWCDEHYGLKSALEAIKLCSSGQHAAQIAEKALEEVK